MSEGFTVDEFYVTIDANEDYPIMIKDMDNGEEMYMEFDTFDTIVEQMENIRGTKDRTGGFV